MLDASLLSAAAAAIKAAPRGQKNATVTKWAKTLKVSTGTLRNHIKSQSVNWCFQKRKPRNDRGQSRKYDIDTVEKIATLQAKIHPNATHQITDKIAIEMAEDSGLIKPGEISVEAYSRLAKSGGYRRHKKSRNRWRARWPNRLHEFDFSVSPFFKLSHQLASGEWVVRVSKNTMRPYKNKPGAERNRIWYAGLVDSYSSAHYLKMIVMKGESTQAVLDILSDVYRKREEEEQPFYPFGIPEILYVDSGSGFRSVAFNAMGETCGIEIKHPTVDKRSGGSDPAARGKVEQGFRPVWRDFESPWVIEAHPARTVKHQGADIELKEREYLLHQEIEPELARYVRVKNSTAHPLSTYFKAYAGKTKIGAWREISQVFTLDDLHGMAYQIVTRKVNDYNEVMTKGIEALPHDVYKIIGGDGHLPDKTARIFIDKNGRAMCEVEGRRFDMKESVILDDGEYKSFTETANDRVGKKAKDMVIENSRPTAGEEKAGKVLMMPTREVEREVEDPLEIQTEFDSPEEMKAYMSEIIGVPLTAETIPAAIMQGVEQAINNTRNKEAALKSAQYLKAALVNLRDDFDD